MRENIHPMFAAIIDVLAPHVDHEAFGRCSHGHVQGRYDLMCLACKRERFLGERPYRATVLCDCHKPEANGMELPDPQCRKCGGTGEVEAEPF